MTGEMMHNDKRANTRHTIRDDVTLVVLGIPDSEHCILEDISMGGAKFYSAKKLAVGNHVELRIPAPQDEPEILVQAQVLRIEPGDHNKPYGYACIIESTVNA